MNTLSVYGFRHQSRSILIQEGFSPFIQTNFNPASLVFSINAHRNSSGFFLITITFLERDPVFPQREYTPGTRLVLLRTLFLYGLVILFNYPQASRGLCMIPCLYLAHMLLKSRQLYHKLLFFQNFLDNCQ